MRVVYRLRGADLRDVAEEASAAEELGYDGVCSNETRSDPFFPLVMAASATERVSLETRVAIAFPRSPMVVAYSARDLQDFSGGRFRLGLGTQVKGHIERRFSVPWVSPGPRLREYVQSLRAIWESWRTGEQLDYQGRFYRFTLMTPHFDPGPGTYPDPLVYVSALNPYNCRVAGEVCDGLALHPVTTPRYLRDVVLPNVERGVRAVGRSPEDVSISACPFVITGPDRGSMKEQRETVRRQIAFYGSTRTYLPVLKVHGLEELGSKLHEMSLQGRWGDMTNLVGDDVVDVFAVTADYGDLAAEVLGRYGGLADEVCLTLAAGPGLEPKVLKTIVRDLQGSPGLGRVGLGLGAAVGNVRCWSDRGRGEKDPQQ